MSLWIKGETGATLGPPRQLLSALKIRDGKLSFNVLASDRFAWTARTDSVDAGETTIPDTGQKVSLYLDETRIFHGHVVDPSVLLYGVRVGCEGPWWWLRRAETVSDQADAEGASAERPSLVYDTGAIEDHVESLVDLARDGYGLPIRLGTIATMFDIPRVSFTQTSLANVLAGLLEWCPDAVAWFDHSALAGEVVSATSTSVVLDGSASTENDVYNGLEIEIRSGANAGETRVITDYVGSTKTATISPAWTVTPSGSDDYTLEVEASLNITRRGGASAQVYTVGTDPLIEPFEMRPRIELETTQIEIPYADRDATTGAIQYQTQSAGSFTAGKRRIITVSGPEQSDFLPQEPADQGLSIDLDTSTTDLETALRAAIRGFDKLTTDFPEGGSNWLFKAANVSTTKTNGFNAVRPLDGSFGDDIPSSWTNPTLAAGRSFVIFQDQAQPPQWLVDDFGLTKYSVGHWYFIDGAQTTTTPAYNGTRIRAILSVLGGSYYWGALKTDPSGVSPPTYYWVVNDQPAFDLWTMPTADIPASGVFTRDPYQFYSPPAGLAADMLAASNWVPWQGTITRKLETLTAEQPLAKKFSVSGVGTGASTAQALPMSHELDLARRTSTIRLGPPSRRDFASLINRTARSSRDNIDR